MSERRKMKRMVFLHNWAAIWGHPPQTGTPRKPGRIHVQQRRNGAFYSNVTWDCTLFQFAGLYRASKLQYKDFSLSYQCSHSHTSAKLPSTESSPSGVLDRTCLLLWDVPLGLLFVLVGERHRQPCLESHLLIWFSCDHCWEMMVTAIFLSLWRDKSCEE